MRADQRLSTEKPQAQCVPAPARADAPGKIQQLPKHQQPIRVRRSKHAPAYMERKFLLVTPERAWRLQNFAEELKRLCDRYHINLIASPDGDFMEVEERGFRYPDGFSYSATLRDQRKIIIERTWFDEVPAPGASGEPGHAAKAATASKGGRQ